MFFTSQVTLSNETLSGCAAIRIFPRNLSFTNLSPSPFAQIKPPHHSSFGSSRLGIYIHNIPQTPPPTKHIPNPSHTIKPIHAKSSFDHQPPIPLALFRSVLSNYQTNRQIHPTHSPFFPLLSYTSISLGTIYKLHPHRHPHIGNSSTSNNPPK